MTPNENGLQSAATLPEAIQTPSLGEGDAYGATLRVGVNERREMAVDRAETGCRSRAERGPASRDALPCQNSNNSDEKRKRYRLTRVPGSDDLYTTRDNERAVWSVIDGDTIERFGLPTAAEAKAAFHLRLNTASFVEHWGRDHALFFTVTDEENVHPTLFARRWNSFLRRSGAWIRSYIRVLEPQKQGRPHYHLLVAVKWNTLPEEFDWEAFEKCQEERRVNGPSALFRELRERYKRSAAPELVQMWKFLRKVLPRYGLGRAELLPLRKGHEAISEYVGKYLEAGLALRKHSWKGCRRVEFDRRSKACWLVCTRVFAWRSPGSAVWRRRVGELASAAGVTDFEGLRQRFGAKWAYSLREALICSDRDSWLMFVSVVGAMRNV